jgi:hypothetical protein
VATRLKQPAAHAPQSKQSTLDKRRQLDSSARRFHAQEANSSRVSARAAIPSSSAATPDARAIRPRQGGREEFRETTPPPCAAAPSPAAGVSSVPSTPSVRSNLSTPLKKRGQVASPSLATRFTVGCVLELANLLRCLDERAKAGLQAPAPVTGPEGQPNHGADPAGGPANPGPLGPPSGDRQSRVDQAQGPLSGKP